jgi:hypothetical protein
VDCETLCRAVSILIRNLHRDGIAEQAREGLLQISCSDVDEFVNQAVASSLTGHSSQTDELPVVPPSGHQMGLP